MHTPADIQMESRKHTFAGYVHRCTRSRATWICIRFALRRKYTAIRMEDTYCIAHRHTFTQPALPVTDVGRNIASKKALSFLFILSVFWHAYLCTHSVAMSLKLFLFLFQFLCAHFFSLLFPLSRSLLHVIIMNLKSLVPREIRRETDKARGTLAKIFLSVMS